MSHGTGGSKKNVGHSIIDLLDRSCVSLWKYLAKRQHGRPLKCGKGERWHSQDRLPFRDLIQVSQHKGRRQKVWSDEA